MLFLRYLTGLKPSTPPGKPVNCTAPWASLVVETIKKNNPQGIPKYGALLIDESQDMPAWALDFLEIFRRPEASVFVADGPGQELYGESPPWLDQFKTRAKLKVLRRNFRNTRPTFIVAQGYYEAASDRSAIPAYLKKYKGGKLSLNDGQLSLGFDRPKGLAPRMVRIDDSSIWTIAEDAPYFPDHQEEVMVQELTQVIRQEIESLKDEAYPTDLLILVPDTSSSSRNWTKRVLDDLCVEYIDYTEDAYRRSFPRREQIRFCTYHSARGIEALRVVLVGFDHIESLGKGVRASHRSLGYIVLSRALINTAVVRTSSGSASAKFLDELVAKVATMKV